MQSVLQGFTRWRRCLGRGWSIVLVSLPAQLVATEAPASADGSIYQYTFLTMGISVTREVIRVLRSDGTFTQLYSKSSIEQFPASPTTGTYTYAKTGANTAVLTMTPTGTTAAEAHTLNFATTPSPSFSAPFGGGPFRMTALPLTEPLINTSQRAWISDTEPAIIGLVVPPQQMTVVLIRAVGPGLAAFPGTTPAADPRLDVYQGSQLIWSNNDWEIPAGQTAAAAGVADTVAAISDFVGAFPLAPGSRDAAIVLFLPPGQYTVHLRNATGQPRAEVLGEIYVVH